MSGRAVRKRILALALTAALFLGLVPGAVPAALAAQTATSIRLEKTEGTVSVKDSAGKGQSVRAGMRLTSGSKVTTSAKSYAWIALDDTKAAKLDASSTAEVRKSGKKLEILATSGTLSFNVSKPLAEDESLNIRTSTMVTGIRGTCGYLSVASADHTRLTVLEGRVECGTDSGSVNVESGQTADFYAGADRTPVVAPADPDDIPGTVLVELAADQALREKIAELSGIDLRDLTMREARERLLKDQAEAAARSTGTGTANASRRSSGGGSGGSGYVPDRPDPSTPSDGKPDGPDRPDPSASSDGKPDGPDRPDPSAPSDGKPDGPDRPDPSAPSDGKSDGPDRPDPSAPSDGKPDGPDRPDPSASSDGKPDGPGKPGKPASSDGKSDGPDRPYPSAPSDGKSDGPGKPAPSDGKPDGPGVAIGSDGGPEIPDGSGVQYRLTIRSDGGTINRLKVPMSVFAGRWTVCTMRIEDGWASGGWSPDDDPADGLVWTLGPWDPWEESGETLFYARWDIAEPDEEMVREIRDPDSVVCYILTLYDAFGRPDRDGPLDGAAGRWGRFTISVLDGWAKGEWELDGEDGEDGGRLVWGMGPWLPWDRGERTYDLRWDLIGGPGDDDGVVQEDGGEIPDDGGAGTDEG